MANTRELRRRIRSVKNTSQITKAMQMVAATKMRKAQTQALSGRPYSEQLNYALSQLQGRIHLEMHPLLGGIVNGHPGGERREPMGSNKQNKDFIASLQNDSKKIGLLLLSTDKALCGALNTNLFRSLQTFINDQRITNDDLCFYTLGKKGRGFVVKTGRDLVADFENPELVIFRQSRQIAKVLIETFLSGEIKQVFVLYPHFVSTLRQEPKIVKLLPIDNNVIANEVKQSQISGKEIAPSPSINVQGLRNNGSSDFLIEPDPDELLDFVLTHQVETQIYQALLETKASEHSARMIAMQNATDNAKELVDDLTLSYNQTRQDAITKELLEITTAAAALE